MVIFNFLTYVYHEEEEDDEDVEEDLAKVRSMTNMVMYSPEIKSTRGL